MDRSETLAEKSAKSTLQLGTFIAELHRFVQLIEANIQLEQERSRVFDLSMRLTRSRLDNSEIAGTIRSQQFRC
jgi:hypothetical protein